MEINKQISDIASQERLLTQLKQQGSVDPDIFISRGNLLAERRRELKLQKERILRSEEDHILPRQMGQASGDADGKGKHPV